MKSLHLNPDFYITPDADGAFRQGQILHVKRNAVGGGSVATPVGRYFAWRPDIGAEGYHPYWRLDCFVRDHELAPAEDWLARQLADALLGSGIVSEPLWLGWHRATEMGGEARGEVFND
jgi:hypothetical protein